MRTHLTFDCQGAALAATLDHGEAATGLLIVSGGNEVRSGPYRAKAAHAAHFAGLGYPVFRFDRRGIGDSEGTNGGFESSADDLAAAVGAFRAHCPHLTRIVAYGNCDAAAALVLHATAGIDSLVVSNIWTIDTLGALDDPAAAAPPALPAPGAIRARYLARLRDPRSLLRLLRGEVDLRKLWRGLTRLRAPAPSGTLAPKILGALAATPRETRILLAAQDSTAMVFADVWAGRDAARARANPAIRVARCDTPSHSFAREADTEWLRAQIHAALRDHHFAD